MAKEIKIWYDEESDYLEVLFERKEGYFRETANDAVMEKVDKQGNLIGFSILRMSAFRGQKPLAVTLLSKAAGALKRSCCYEAGWGRRASRSSPSICRWLFYSRANA